MNALFEKILALLEYGNVTNKNEQKRSAIEGNENCNRVFPSGRTSRGQLEWKTDGGTAVKTKARHLVVEVAGARRGVKDMTNPMTQINRQRT